MNRLGRFLAPLVLSALACVASTAFAAQDMFLKIDGVEGESTDEQHPNEIEVLSWGWQISNAESTTSGGGGGTSRPVIRPITVLKYIDKSSPQIYRLLLTGEVVVRATLTVRKAGEIPVDYVKIELEPVIITSASPGASIDDDRVTEQISIAFGKICFQYTPQDPKGGSGAAVETCWNTEANKIE